jgi:hypothetical protein
MLINHYYPNSVPNNKIIMMPRSNMDNKMNLKKFQEALFFQNIKTITFDVFVCLFRFFESLKCRTLITGNSSLKFIDIAINSKTTKKIPKSSAIKIKANSPQV